MENFKQYANSFQAKSRLGLESIGALTQKLGNPQKKLKFIHVAGTNGKGSVCAFLQSILTSGGLKTGKFISPNMIDVCERISVDGENISQKELDLILEKVESAAKEVEQEKGVFPTQFEIWTAAAFLYFCKKSCDAVVLETGLGGRLDATNIIDSPLLCVITKVDIDHTEYLGNTLEEIAFEKAGIIKEKSAVISAEQSPKVLEVLESTAKKRGCSFLLASSPKNLSHNSLTEIFDYKELKNLKINLAGIHQTQNASLAIEAARFLKISEKAIRDGLFTARNIGRFEKLRDNPTVIFDGAHNKNGTAALIKAIKRYFPNEKFSFIYAAMADKDIDSSLNCFKENGFCESGVFYTVKVKDNPRSENADTLKEKFKKAGFLSESFPSLKEAYEKALGDKRTVIVCGSLYLYKDFMTEIGK